jgi:hypothetical protein
VLPKRADAEEDVEIVTAKISGTVTEAEGAVKKMYPG